MDKVNIISSYIQDIQRPDPFPTIIPPTNVDNRLMNNFPLNFTDTPEPDTPEPQEQGPHDPPEPQVHIPEPQDIPLQDIPQTSFGSSRIIALGLLIVGVGIGIKFYK